MRGLGISRKMRAHEAHRVREIRPSRPMETNHHALYEPIGLLSRERDSRKLVYFLCFLELIDVYLLHPRVRDLHQEIGFDHVFQGLSEDVI